ncbi:hypothetical protein M513_07566 [Trichuris suis]|uniref:Uncharacterized protein n=1 Tax=Trichuris suis TaxID=68888 RepID=A0A085M2S0_9BILA|nr:hypothetical protein M513_07566 [Trichuris suis]
MGLYQPPTIFTGSNLIRSPLAFSVLRNALSTIKAISVLWVPQDFACSLCVDLTTFQLFFSSSVGGISKSIVFTPLVMISICDFVLFPHLLLLILLTEYA